MRKFFAFLLLIIFIPVFILAVLTWSIRSTLLNKEFVKDELSKNKVYEFIHEETLSIVTEDKASEIPPNLLTTSELTKLAQGTITVDFLQNEVENLIDNVYPYLLSQEDSFEAEIDLEEVKQAFGNNLVKLAKAKKISINSAITREITDEMPNKVILSNEGISFEPKNFNLFEEKEDAEDFSRSFAESFAGIRNFISVSNFISTLLIISSGLIVILIAALRFGSLKSITKWVGWALFIPALFLSFFAFIYKFFLIDFLSGALFSVLFSDTQEDFASIGSFFIGNQEKAGLIFEVIKDINQQILIQMGVLTAFALVLIIASNFLKSKENQKINP